MVIKYVFISFSHCYYILDPPGAYYSNLSPDASNLLSFLTSDSNSRFISLGNDDPSNPHIFLRSLCAADELVSIGFLLDLSVSNN